VEFAGSDIFGWTRIDCGDIGSRQKQRTGKTVMFFQVLQLSSRVFEAGECWDKDSNPLAKTLGKR
jgi:hypothetical protein